jgi:hypothetical protein
VNANGIAEVAPLPEGFDPVSGSDLYADDSDAAPRHTIGVALSHLEVPATTARARTFWAHIVPE